MHDPENVWHVGGNLALLALFGVPVERAIGSFRFATLFVVGGFVGAGLHVVVDANSVTPLVGCSGSLFAVLAVAAVLWPGLLGFVVAFAGINLFELLTGTGGSVAVGAHLGGFACGVVLVALARLRGVELRPRAARASA